MTRERLRGPEEGWLTIGLVMLMCLVLASAIDDPAWVNGRGWLTDCLVWFAAAGVLIGFAGPKIGWGRWTTHGVGALFAGLIIPIVAGLAERPGLSIPAAFTEAAHGSVQAYLDIAWRSKPFTGQEIHYIVSLGIIVWGTAQFASYAVFGHRHPLNAVVVSGLVLVTNMALTQSEQLPYLVLFTAAALFLLIEMHAFDERATWIRRRIGDPGTISALYLRGGTVFILLAMLGSLLLTNRAASSPLAGAWDGINSRLIEMSETFGRLLPVGGNMRGAGGVMFGNDARISGRWTPGTGVAFRATLPANSPKNMYWRAVTYDKFILIGWSQTSITKEPVDTAQPLLAGTDELPPVAISRPIEVQVERDTYHDLPLLSPGIPWTVDEPSDLLRTGDHWVTSVELGSSDDYTLQARRLLLDDEDAISGHRLMAASQTYPPDVVALYTAVPPGAIGPDATALLEDVTSRAGSTNPYVLADTMVKYLSDETVFTYDTDVTDTGCQDESAVECFARYRRGYCLHFASTMAILLRKEGIPTRVVQGFLPGNRTGNVETVDNQAAHAWVEVFFPGYGWIPFDPTGHGVGKPSEIKLGPSLPPTSPTPRASNDRDPEGPSSRPLGGSSNPPGGRGGTSQPGDRVLFLLLTVGVVLLVGGVAFAAWLRGPRGEITPDRAWLQMSAVAKRLGYGPRPTQTVYEYAASLGELVPVARADLDLVADAKVETAYARRRFGGDRLEAIDHAARRLRVSLLRLVFRRGRRRGRPAR